MLDPNQDSKIVFQLHEEYTNLLETLKSKVKLHQGLQISVARVPQTVSKGLGPRPVHEHIIVCCAGAWLVQCEGNTDTL